MDKAMAGAADALSFDLEDAVPEAEKAAARSMVATFLDGGSGRTKELIVRVNALATGLLFDDVLAVASPNLDVVNVPKVEAPRDLHVADELLRHIERSRGIAEGTIKLIPTLETPPGLRRALDIARASTRVTAIQLGTGDLSTATGIEPATARLGPVRLMLVLAAAEAGVDALDSAFTGIARLDAFEADAIESKGLGFRGKSCIHPSQVPIANRVFAPTKAELEDARALVDAYEEAVKRGVGAISHRGMLVDAPIAQAALRLLEAAS